MVDQNKVDGYVSAPLIYPEPEDGSWDREFDIVVVGYGAAGVSAALEAVERGYSVLAVDRFHGGGASALSGGVFYAGGGTQYQKENNFEDSPENMFRYLRLECEDVVSEETLRRFCNTSVATLEWLESHGVEFNGAVSPVKTSYPLAQHYLYYSGNEMISGFKEHASPAPRGHRAVGKGLSGSAFYRPLQRSAADKGVEASYQSRVNRLIVGSDGEVLGVEVKRIPADSAAGKKMKIYCRLIKELRQYFPPAADYFRKKARLLEMDVDHLETERIRARCGVIIAAGGFVMNPAMVEKYAAKYTSGLPLGDTGCDGVGIRLGLSVGAAVDRMERFSAWRFINPPQAWCKGLVVNLQGKRFCNEEVYGARLGHYMVEENDGRAFLILDSNLMKQAMSQAMPWKLWLFQSLPAIMNMRLNSVKAMTVAELETKCSLPTGSLKSTIERYNEFSRGEIVDEFGKLSTSSHEFEDGPIYAMDISLGSQVFPCPVLSFGGLAVDETSGLVKNHDGEAIRGLYACGRSSVGIASNQYQSGLSLADCVFSGRRAGAHAAPIPDIVKDSQG